MNNNSINKYTSTNQKTSIFSSVELDSQDKCSKNSELDSIAQLILKTPGFIPSPTRKDDHYRHSISVKVRNNFSTSYINLSKTNEQGTPQLREVTAMQTKGSGFHALCPSVLRKQKQENPDQYWTLKLKRIGHAFDLKGILELKNKKVNLEGFCEAFTIPMLASSFSHFVDSLDSNKEYAKWLKQDVDWIIDTFNETTCSDLITEEDIDRIGTQIRDPDFIGPLCIGTGYDWHFSFAVFLKNYLIYGDRGKIFNKDLPGLHVFKLPDRQLFTADVVHHLTKRQEWKRDHFFKQDKLTKDLKAKHRCYYPFNSQNAGNCTYANAQMGMFIILALAKSQLHLTFAENDSMKLPVKLSVYDWKHIFEGVQPIYEDWLTFDRNYILQDFFLDVTDISSQKELENITLISELVRKIFFSVKEHKLSISQQNLDLLIKHGST